MNLTDAINISNYAVSGNFVAPITAAVATDGATASEVQLSIDLSGSSDLDEMTITVTNIRDVFGNVIDPGVDESAGTAHSR